MQHSHIHTQQQPQLQTDTTTTSPTLFIIPQININDIKQNRATKNLVHNTQPNILTIHETQLTHISRAPKYLTTPPYPQTVNTSILKTINTHNIELQLVKIHIRQNK